MLTSVICSSTCVPQLASTSRLTVSWIAQILLVYLYPGWPRRRCIVLDLFSRRFHLCLVVSIDTNLFWFFLLMCFTIDQTSSSVSSLFWATLWTLLLLTCLTISNPSRLVYLHLLSTKSKSSLKGLVQVLHLNCLRLTFNLTWRLLIGRSLPNNHDFDVD